MMLPLLLAAAAALLSTPAQPQAGEPPAQALPAIERAAAWPALDAKAAAALAQDVERVRKAATPQMEEAGEAGVLAAGAGAAPALLAALGKEKDLQARLRLENLLDTITGAAHTRLLASEFANKSPHVRAWTLRRVAAFPDTQVRTLAEQAFERAASAHAKKPDAEGAADELYLASLCAASTGSALGFEQLVQAATEQWGKRGGELRAALQGLRGDAATDKLLPLASHSERKYVVAALNLLGACGSRKALGAVRPHLDSTDNSIRVAAINAMRGIVDGEPPIDKLSAFDAIELAKRWKERAL